MSNFFGELYNVTNSIFFTIILFSMFYTIFSAGLYLVKKSDIEEMKVYVEAEKDFNSVQFLDKLIEEVFKNYILKNPNQDYINSEAEEIMMKEITFRLYQHLSPMMISRLRLYYSNKAIGTIISEKVYLLVIGYVVDNNKIKEKI